MIRWLHIVTVLVAISTTTARGQEPAAKTHVVFVGASVSAGHAWRTKEGYAPDSDPIRYAGRHLGRAVSEIEYRLRTDNISFANALRAAGDKRRLRVTQHTDPFAFSHPAKTLDRQIRDALRNDADLIVGFDLLFWIGYGPTRRPGRESAEKVDREKHDAKQRLQRQAKFLERIGARIRKSKAWLVVADHPEYLAHGDLALLPRGHRPSPKTLRSLNEQLQAWARKQPRVLVYPIRSVLERARKGQLVIADGEDKLRFHTSDTLQLDEIHPNRFGTCILLHDFALFAKRELPSLAKSMALPSELRKYLDAVRARMSDLRKLRTLRAKTKKR